MGEPGGRFMGPHGRVPGWVIWAVSAAKGTPLCELYGLIRTLWGGEAINSHAEGAASGLGKHDRGRARGCGTRGGLVGKPMASEPAALIEV